MKLFDLSKQNPLPQLALKRDLRVIASLAPSASPSLARGHHLRRKPNPYSGRFLPMNLVALGPHSKGFFRY